MSQQKKTEKMSVFSDRLKSIRARRGLSQADLARILGVSTGNVGNWESKRSLPSNKSLGNIAAKLSVSTSFLIGEEDHVSEVLKEVSPGYKLPGNARLTGPHIEYSKQKVPVISWAAAGRGGNFSDLEGQIDEYMESDCPDANAYALIIEGDSMIPEYRPGDRVIFLPNAEARNGDIVVARLLDEGDVYFKMFHLIGSKGDIVKLTSYNPMYPPLEYPRKAFRFIHPMYEMRRRPRR